MDLHCYMLQSILHLMPFARESMPAASRGYMQVQEDNENLRLADETIAGVQVGSLIEPMYSTRFYCGMDLIGGLGYRSAGLEEDLVK